MVQVEERRRGAEALVREGAAAERLQGVREAGEQFAGDPKVSCDVRHEDAGGQCEREAVMEVYGLFFCEVHGAEAKAGCLEELYNNAEQYLEFFEGAEHVRGMNREALKVLRAGLEAAGAATWREPGFESGELLLRAYPVMPERVDPETSGFDYDSPGEGPYDWFRRDRLIIHHLIRLAFEEGLDYLLESLEEYREHIAAQAAFALEDLQRRYEEPRRKS